MALNAVCTGNWKESGRSGSSSKLWFELGIYGKEIQVDLCSGFVCLRGFLCFKGPKSFVPLWFLLLCSVSLPFQHRCCGKMTNNGIWGCPLGCIEPGVSWRDYKDRNNLCINILKRFLFGALLMFMNQTPQQWTEKKEGLDMAYHVHQGVGDVRIWI